MHSMAVRSQSRLQGQVATTSANGAEQRNCRSRSGRLVAKPTLNLDPAVEIQPVSVGAGWESHFKGSSGC